MQDGNAIVSSLRPWVLKCIKLLHQNFDRILLVGFQCRTVCKTNIQSGDIVISSLHSFYITITYLRQFTEPQCSRSCLTCKSSLYYSHVYIPGQAMGGNDTGRSCMLSCLSTKASVNILWNF